MAKIWDDVDCKVNFCKGDSTRNERISSISKNEKCFVDKAAEMSLGKCATYQGNGSSQLKYLRNS